MLTDNNFQILMLREESYALELIENYLYENGHRVNSFKISANDAQKLFKHRESLATFLTVLDKGEEVEVSSDDIQYIKVDHVYIEIYTISGKKYIQRGSLKDILEFLPSAHFVQTHRSYAVNLREVTRWNKSNVFVKEAQIPLSRNNRKSFREMLKELMK